MPVVTPVALDSPRVKQLSDGNATGTVMGVSPADLLGFYGNTIAPVAQPSGNAQAAIARGVAAGQIITFATSQSPISIAGSTTQESQFTVQAGTGVPNSPLATDLIFVNKRAAQGGLSVGNARGISQNIVGISFGNVTGTSIVPTQTDVYTIIALRGMATTSATLSPAAVAANTTAEQLFTVTGIRLGELVQVNKPSVQAGLEIVGCRAAANNQLGITFANYTAAAITPTAAEAYTVFSLGGLDAVTNEVTVQANLSPASVAIQTSTEFSATVAGLQFGDTVVGVQKPTQQAALIVGGGRVSVPSTIGITFANLLFTSNVITQGECYSIALRRQNPLAPLLVTLAALTPTAVPALTTAEQTFTVGGLLVSTAAWVNKPSPQPGLGIAGVRVSGLNTLAITFVNTTALSITPTAGETYTIGAFQAAQPTGGNSVGQSAVQVSQSQSVLANAMRNALAATGGMGLIAGA